MNRVPITADGARKLREQLRQLKTVERPRIIKEIAAARDHGDISENAEFHAAKEQQGFIEGRIQALEGQLGHAQVIDPTTLNAGGKVVFGATLDLLDCDGGGKVTYQIVGDLEADITDGKISISSPIARALIGQEEGDIVDVDVPDGVRSYEILTVRYV